MILKKHRLTTQKQTIPEKEPLSLSPRSSGTNTQTSSLTRFREVPGLRTFLSGRICFIA